MPQLASLPSFSSVWRSILDVLAAAAAANRKEGEVLAEALPEALKNMLLVLHSKVRTVLCLVLYLIYR